MKCNFLREIFQLNLSRPKYFSVTLFPKMNTSPEKLCLNWKNFQQNISSAFRELRSDNDFSDVTLACEDGFQVSAHKVILASSSPFFMNILKMNKNPHPFIYMRGMKSEDLVAIVDFLYFGEAELEEDNLDAFLALAEELKVTGLTTQGSAAAASKKTKKVVNKSKMIQDIPRTRSPKEELEHARVKGEELVEVEAIGGESESGEEIVEILETDKPELLVETDAILRTIAEDFNEEFPKEMADEIDIGTKVRSMMDFSENLVMSNKKPGTTMGRARVCKVCGKEGVMAAILSHIETKHIAKVASPCDICGIISKSRSGLIQHKLKKHSK